MERNYGNELATLIKAGSNVVEIVSYEWERVHVLVHDAAQEFDILEVKDNKGNIIKAAKPCRWYIWSATLGLRVWDDKKYTFIDIDSGCVTIKAAMDWFRGLKENALIVLEDCHPYLDNSSAYNIRYLREMMRLDTYEKQTFTKAIVLSTPRQVIPDDLVKELPIINIDLSDRQTIEIVAHQTVNKYHDICFQTDITQKVLESALGLTIMEARTAFSKAIVQNHKLTEEEIPLIISQKEQIINNSGLLEYYHPSDYLSDIGGLENLKEWIRKRSRAYTDAARNYGLPVPRGVLLLGVPGCGKSLTAKAIACEWKMPLLKFDLGKVFGGLVGESERNIRYALDIAKTVSPCVLWIDEIEKGLSGSQSSGRTDGGTSSRVMGTFLTWLQEKKEPVFVVATANDIEQLPPELLRKGRLDEIFFVDLPSTKERENIFNIHLRKKGRDPKALGLNMKELTDLTVNFSGAEIEEVINESLFSAFAANKPDLTQYDLVQAIQSTVPLSQTMADDIKYLRRWSNCRARKASAEEPENVEELEEVEQTSSKDAYSRYAGLMKKKENAA